MAKRVTLKDLRKIIGDMEETLFRNYVRDLRYILMVGKELGNLDRAYEMFADIISSDRVKWVNKNRDICGNEPDATIAGKAILFDYMHINEEDITILEETKDRFVFESRNPCPVLEACKTLGLKTTDVCKKAYEPPAQAYAQAVHPNLRFKRDYTKIRPGADHCHEEFYVEE